MSLRNARLGIVVGIDDSPAARTAVQWAARDAELRNVPLTLVHAVSPEVSTWLKTPMAAGVMRWQQDHGRRLVDEALKVVEETTERGGPAGVHSEILASRSRSHVDRLVQRCGNGRRGGTRQWAVARPASRLG